MPEERTVVRSRRVGLRDIHIALVTANNEGAYTAGVPEKFARAITAKISDKYTVEKIYSDDGVEDVVNNYEGTDIELEVNALADVDKNRLLGWILNKGYQVQTAQIRAPEVALGFRSKRNNGKYEFAWYYCGRFDPSLEEEYETVGEKKNAKTASLKASFYQRAKLDTAFGNSPEGTEQNLVCIRVDESNLAATEAEAAAAIANWFAKVQEHPSVEGGN